ncbi:MAG TPA: TonB-dependent receptor [Mucilaginibacter sp.]|nr:TonB-dependent receptor [Mucilaginibacter sp.]
MFKSLLLKGRTMCILILCTLSSLVVTAQTRITGKVIGSDDKQPVIGATVKIKGTNVGAVTDVNGAFAVNAKDGDVLVISFIGYQSKNVTVSGPSLGTIVLDATNSTLNEVVVTGYTTQVKKNISGAVATVDISAAKQVPTTSAESLLQGQAAGVTVVEQGSPGAAANVYIRGISNFGNSQPLYVIDGVQTGSMQNVNPNDIESISVLKDAGSAAIYGVSGGNGVVLVTTKKGKQGKTKFTYDAYYGSTAPKGGNPFNLLNAAQFEQLVKQVDPQNPLLGSDHAGFKEFGYQSGTGATSPTGSPVRGVGNSSDPLTNAANYQFDGNNPANDYQIQKFTTGAGTDWFHEVFKSAPQQQHTLTASGASDKNSYYFSTSYTNQQGTLIETYFKRYSSRINTVFSLNDHIRIGENAQVSFISEPNGPQNTGGIPGGNQGEGNNISEIYRMEPQIPVYDIQGNFGGTYAGPAALGNGANPVASQTRTLRNHSRNWVIQGTGFAEVDFLKHFTARTSMSLDISNYYYNNINENTYDQGEGHANLNGASEGAGYSSSYNWSNTVKYNQTFGKHAIAVLGGFEAKEYVARNINASVNSLFSLDPAYVSIGAGDPKSILANAGPDQPTSALSYFGSLDYTYNDRYILHATVRRDGSSVFFPGRQYGTFPSVSLAWRVTQEDFMKGITWLNDFKIRGSYGEAGFQGNVGGGNAYDTFGSAVANSGYDINGTLNTAIVGYYATHNGNTKTTWENDKGYNVGFDASLFNHFDLSVDYFKKISSKLLFAVVLPGTTGGAGAPAVNIGEVQNKGLDVSLTYHGRVNNDIKFNISTNITSYSNKITALDSPQPDNGQRQGTIVLDQVGHPMGEFYGYKVIGYFRDAADVTASATQDAAAPGRFKYADINGDHKITDADRTPIGNPNAKFNYGLNLNATIKGFDVLAIFYGSYGGQIYNFTKYWTEFYGTFAGNKSLTLLNDSWTPTNLNAKDPKAETGTGFSNTATINSWYVEPGSFLKLRTLQVGYTFGSQSLKFVGVDRLHVYVQGTNLFTATKYSGLDPELQAVPNTSNGLGTDIGNYPNNERKIIFGVNLTF